MEMWLYVWPQPSERPLSSFLILNESWACKKEEEDLLEQPGWVVLGGRGKSKTTLKILVFMMSCVNSGIVLSTWGFKKFVTCEAISEQG